MIRILIAFIIVCLIAIGLAWFADQPGELSVVWLGHKIETTFLFATAGVLLLCALSILIWGVFRRIFGTPAAITEYFRNRRQRLGYDALSKGIIAIGSGDKSAALTHAKKASKLLANEPLTLLLKAQTSQLKGEMEASKNAYEAMLQNPDTEILGLRGLYLLAQQNDDEEAEKFYAERAAQIKPGLTWASEAILGLHSAHGEWEKAEKILEDRRRFKLIDKSEEARQKAVLMTARALEKEVEAPDEALELALSAHKLAPELVPASIVAGRILSDKGELRKASSVLEKTWGLSPHPDVAEVYGAARAGDAPMDRLERIKSLTARDDHEEARMAVAQAAIEAQNFDEAIAALENNLGDAPSMRMCELTAKAYEGLGDMGRAREWLSRAVHARRDPMWIADGYATDQWAPISPITGELDSFEWKVPLEQIGSSEEEPELFDDEQPEDDIVELEVEPKQQPVSDQGPSASDKPAIELAQDDKGEKSEGAEQAGKDKAARTDKEQPDKKPAQSAKKPRKAKSAMDQAGEDLVVPPQPDDPGTEGPAEVLEHDGSAPPKKGFLGRLFGN